MQIQEQNRSKADGCHFKVNIIHDSFEPLYVGERFSCLGKSPIIQYNISCYCMRKQRADELDSAHVRFDDAVATGLDAMLWSARVHVHHTTARYS